MAVPDNKLYKKMPLELNRDVLKYLNNEDVDAGYQMTKPSNLASKDRAKVRLDLKKKEDIYQIEVMHKIRHRNILRLEAIKEMTVRGQSVYAVFVERHNGPFIGNLKGLEADTRTRSLPSQCLRDAIWQMVLGIEVLRVNGYYHGDLSVKNIYVSIEGSAVIIKFANFREKDEEIGLETAQLRDWVCLGDVLAYISRAARALDNNVSCSVIDHLASKLQALTDTTSLPDLKSNTLSDPFFWTPRKRSTFYIHDLQRALEDQAFVDRVQNYQHWQLPWDNTPVYGVITAMNAHRVTVLKKARYDGEDPLAYVKCMSGAYKHQEELAGKVVDSAGNKLSVDAAVQKNRPDLCLTLYRLLRGDIAPEEEEEEEAAAAAVDGEE